MSVLAKLNETIVQREALSPRYIKELRLLLLPWCVAAGAALVLFISASDFPALEVGAFIFCGSVALMAGLSFGAEFQQRTMSLLVGQPLARSRIWRDKMLVLGAAGTALALLFWWTQQVAQAGSEVQDYLYALFILASICSVGLWVRVTRSTGAGLAVGVATQLVVIVGLAWTMQSCIHTKSYAWDETDAALLLAGCAIYLVGLLWLGRNFWRKRLFKLLLAAGGAEVVYWLARFSMAHSNGSTFSNQDAILVGTCLLAAICSSSFWTLLAESTIGGAVFNVASQVLVGMGLMVVLPRVFPVLLAEETKAGVAILVTGVIYSLVFLWLGRWRFLRMELKESPSAGGGRASLAFAPSWLRTGWLRCRRQGPLSNLIRKELWLQRPVLNLALILIVVCLVTLGAQLAAPERRALLENVFGVVLVIYIPASLLLASCVPLGEEKSLGLAAWQLTLPVGAFRQWWTKVAIGALVGVVLGLVLPALLALAAAGLRPAELSHFLGSDAGLVTLMAAGMLVAAGCWGAALFGNVVRAAVGATIAFVVLSACAGLSILFAGRLGGLQTDLLVNLGEYYPSWGAFFGGGDFIEIAGVITVGAVAGTALWQGFLQFRRAQVTGAICFRYSLILLLVVILAAAWWGDLAASTEGPFNSRHLGELLPTTQRMLAHKPEPSPGKWHDVDLAELEKVAPLSRGTKTRHRIQPARFG